MRSRALGASGLRVSVLGLGGNNFGWRIGEAQTRRVVAAALDEGVNFFDTADCYAETVSESMLGAALRGRRSEAIIATKFGLPVPGAPDAALGSRRYIQWAVQRSLARLGTDVIDLYQYHRPDGLTPLAETVAALAELQRAGTIRAFGLSNVDEAQLVEAQAAAYSAGTAIATVQNRASVIRRAEIAAACVELGCGLIPFSPLESGILTGKYVRDAAPPLDSRLGSEHQIWPAKRWLTSENFERLEAVHAFAAAHELTLLEVAIGGLAAMPAVASVIAGATTPEQVQANAAAVKWQPDRESLAQLVASIPIPVQAFA